MIIRAKNKTLFTGKPLTDTQRANSELNMQELESGVLELKSLPRRIVLELTNACNLSCTMCGRNAADFKLTRLNMDWFFALEPLFDTIEEVTLMGWGEPTIHPQFIKILETISHHTARKYFCTNGMRLDLLTDAIFKYAVDVFAVSVDGAVPETNNTIRKGSDLEKINRDLKKIIEIKKVNNYSFPYINYVFCAMRSNLHELVNMVEMTADVGLEELKVVHLTAFDERFVSETLWDCQSEITEMFGLAAKRADELGVLLKLPYIQGEDPAGDMPHRECYVAYRDFYLGSDGFVRPCMSTPDKFSLFSTEQDFMDLWNSEQYRTYRKTVNTPEMHGSCRDCYQSSHCNWNKKGSYIQAGKLFAPEWEN